MEVKATLLRRACAGLLPQEGLENDEQRVGAEIVRRALPYSLKLIARNAGTNGSVVVQKVTGSCPISAVDIYSMSASMQSL